jgi:glucose/arabinose dehydrogenase
MKTRLGSLGVRIWGSWIVATCVIAAPLTSACNSDDEGTGSGGAAGRGTGGAAGKAGAAGRGGTAGGGGTAGRGGTAGKGGVAGTGGTAEGGEAGVSGAAGGEAGESGVSQGGEGGAGGEISVFRPELRPFSDARFAGLEVANGFEINVYASDAGHARMLAVHGEHVYLTRPMQGDVLRFVDDDGDGVADARATVATDLMNVHGIAFQGDTVYLATDKRVLRATVTVAGDFDALADIIDDLPDGGQHPFRTLGVGPDSALYISVGSSCDACEETNPEHATILRSSLDGVTRTVFAEGLRNTIGFGWHPETSELWGMDHGSDFRGDDLPPEELNRIQSGKNYGWPYCFADRQIDPVIDDPPGTTKEAYCAMTEPSVLENQAHGAPIGLVFYDAESFPEEYSGDAFIALHGSWNRLPATGYKVARVRFDAGEPVAFEDFVTGFLIEDGQAEFGRPAGITVAPDGSLLFSDDDNGVIYRVAPTP